MVEEPPTTIDKFDTPDRTTLSKTPKRVNLPHIKHKEASTHSSPGGSIMSASAGAPVSPESYPGSNEYTLNATLRSIVASPVPAINCTRAPLIKIKGPVVPTP